MTVGKVIRECRKIRKMSLTELGKAAGFTKGADVRISQYQADRAVPTTAIKKRLASALGISKYALSPPSLTSNIEIMHTLFKLDDKFPLYIGKHNNRVFMFFEPSDTELKSMLECWHNKQTELKADKISPEEYDLWKYSFESLSDGANAEHLY